MLRKYTWLNSFLQGTENCTEALGWVSALKWVSCQECHTHSLEQSFGIAFLLWVPGYIKKLAPQKAKIVLFLPCPILQNCCALATSQQALQAQGGTLLSCTFLCSQIWAAGTALLSTALLLGSWGRPSQPGAWRTDPVLASTQLSDSGNRLDPIRHPWVTKSKTTTQLLKYSSMPRSFWTDKKHLP